MQNENTEDLLITIPLVDYLDALLGDNESVPIDNRLAEIIFSLCRNKKLAYIQWRGEHSLTLFGIPIKQTLLWRHKSYFASAEACQSARHRAEAERRQRFVDLYNIDQAMKTIMKFADLEERFAHPLAVDKVLKNKEAHIIAMGGKPFIKTFEELP